MEEKFIEQLKQDLKGADFGSKQDNLQLWYNKEGDCIQFKTMQHVPVARRRIDEYLTLYISIENKKPIGFQLKDIHALIAEHGNLMTVQAGYTFTDKSVISITALILKAFVKMPESINRFSGYRDAFSTMARDVENLEIPIA